MAFYAPLPPPSPPLRPPRVHPEVVRLERVGDEIAELSARLDAATYQLLVLIRDFDENGGWAEQGAKSCAHWLSWRVGLAAGAAREKVRVARCLAQLPHISDALRQGKVSYSKVRALTRVATPENEESLLRLAMAATAGQVERLIRAWRRVDRLAAAQHTESRREHRYLQTYVDHDGMVVVRGRLEPEAGAALCRALEAAMERLYEMSRPKPGARQDVSAERSTYNQRQADAIAIVAESALANGLDPGTRGDRYQVVLHVDAESLRAPSEAAEDGTAPETVLSKGADSPEPGKSGESHPDPPSPCCQSALEDGQYVSAETSRRLACDASRVVMTHTTHLDGGSILDVGRKTRTISPALRRALTSRDRGCCFPGCNCRICDAHHVEHWADGGATRLDNLVLLCRAHHRAVHEEGFRMELLGEGQLRFHDPRGRPIPLAPEPPSLPDDPLGGMAEREGLEIGPWTAPVWAGDPMDLGFAIDTLRGDAGFTPHHQTFYDWVKERGRQPDGASFAEWMEEERRHKAEAVRVGTPSARDSRADVN